MQPLHKGCYHRKCTVISYTAAVLFEVVPYCLVNRNITCITDGSQYKRKYEESTTIILTKQQLVVDAVVSYCLSLLTEIGPSFLPYTIPCMEWIHDSYTLIVLSFASM
jgi:hypothetical protein